MHFTHSQYFNNLDATLEWYIRDKQQGTDLILIPPKLSRRTRSQSSETGFEDGAVSARIGGTRGEKTDHEQIQLQGKKTVGMFSVASVVAYVR